MLRALLGYAAKMFAANTATGLVTFAVTMLAAKDRSRAAMGNYFTYMTIYTVIQTVMLSGVNAAIQKYGAASDEDRMKIAAACYRLFFWQLLVFGTAGVGFGVWLDWTIGLA